MMPEASSRPQSGITSRSAMLKMMSKMPLKSRYQPMSRARIPNVWNGASSAMIPATTNSAPSTPWSHFHASAKPDGDELVDAGGDQRRSRRGSR